MGRKRTIVEGPLGLRLPEKTARYVEDLLKKLPKECRTLKRKTALAASSEFSPGEKADVSWITTDAVDKDREVVLPGGIDLDQYRANPIVLWNHDSASPIGKCLWIKEVGNGIKAKTQYASRPNDHEGEWLPDSIFALVQQGILKGRSIGFIPVEMSPPTQEHLKSRPDWKGANALITKAVLFEYSVVSVPCNGSALVEAVAKGFAADLARCGIAVPSPRASTPAPRKQLDPAAILNGITLDPERIAERVYRQLSERGKV